MLCRQAACLEKNVRNAGSGWSNYFNIQFIMLGQLHYSGNELVELVIHPTLFFASAGGAFTGVSDVLPRAPPA